MNRRKDIHQKRLLRERLFANQDGKCFYCGKGVTLKVSHCQDADYATIEHLIPLSLGGRSHKDKVVVACQRCNSARSSKPIEVFVEELFG